MERRQLASFTIQTGSRILETVEAVEEHDDFNRIRWFNEIHNAATGNTLVRYAVGGRDAVEYACSRAGWGSLYREEDE